MEGKQKGPETPHKRKKRHNTDSKHHDHTKYLRYRGLQYAGTLSRRSFATNTEQPMYE